MLASASELWKSFFDLNWWYLDRSLDFSGFDAGGAHFHALNRLAYQGLERLQVGQPPSFAVRVPVRTQKGVLDTGLRTFTANVTTLSH